LRCIARTGDPDGFGRDISEKLNSALASAPFCRTAKGELAAPDELFRVGTRLKAKDARQLAAMLDPSDDLLLFADDDGVEHWMGELGCLTLGPPQIAARLSPETSELSYRQAVEVIAAWFDTAGRAQLGSLRNRRIVQDSGGQWCRPIDVVVADPDAPKLPKAIRPLHLELPKGSVASDFVLDELGVEELDEGTALWRLLEAVDAGEFGGNATEQVEVLEYLRKLLKRAPRVVAEERRRLEETISVPVRSAGSVGGDQWSPARRVYFGADDVPGSTAEVIYGPLGEPEFLSLTRLPSRKDWVPLFEALGVSPDPRLVPLPSRARWSGWWHELAGDLLLTCPAGHSGSTMVTQGLSIDRIEDLIDSGNVESLMSLAEFLAGQRDPFGGDCTVKCSHSAHQREQPRKIPGYQSWILHHRSWIPVREVSGDLTIRPPTNAWYQVDGSPLAHVVPRALVSDAVASVFGLISGDAPTAAAIETVFVDQAEFHTQLDQAGGAVLSALSLLLQQLEGAVTEGEPALRVTPPFPGSNAGKPCWSSSPIVLDLAEGQHLPVDALPPGDWRRMRGTYGIPRLSEVARIEVRTEPTTSTASGILTAASRAHLVALLARRGQDMREAARRVGLINEVLCERLQLRITLDQLPAVTVQRAHFIQASSSESGAAILYLTSRRTSRDQLDLASELADALGAADLTDLISTYLGYGDAVLEKEGVTEEMVQQASAALARYPHAPSPDAPKPGETEESVSDAAADGEHGASSERSPGPKSRSVVPEPDSAEKSDPEPAPTDHSADDLSWSEPWPEEADGQDGGNGGGSAATSSARRGGSKGTALEPLEVSAEVDVERVVFGRAADGPQESGPSTAQSRRPSAGTGKDSPRTNEAERTVTEHDAMAVVTKFVEKELGGIVRRVDHLNLGWDIEATVPEGEWFIEVKGFAGDSSGFVITKNERAAAYAEEGFRVAIVTGLANGEGRISILERVGTNLERTVRVPMSWSVDDWKTWADQTSYPWREK
jgi:hypothetical protein